MRVYTIEDDHLKLLSITELAEKMHVSEREERERLQGNHCACGRLGDFLLLPVDDPTVVSGGKRYMRCMKCSEYSHL